MPMRDILAKYTKSELAILAWRSSEMAYNIDQSHSETPNDGAMRRPDAVVEGGIDGLEQRLGAVADKITNAEGEVDLRKLTGPEAMRFMSAMGIQIGARA